MPDKKNDTCSVHHLTKGADSEGCLSHGTFCMLNCTLIWWPTWQKWFCWMSTLIKVIVQSVKCRICAHYSTMSSMVGGSTVQSYMRLLLAGWKQINVQFNIQVLTGDIKPFFLAATLEELTNQHVTGNISKWNQLITI